TFSPARPTILFPIIASPGKAALLVRAGNQDHRSVPPTRSRSRCMKAVIGAAEAWDTKKPGRLRVGRAGTGFPPLGTPVRVGVDRSDHDGTRHDRRPNGNVSGWTSGVGKVGWGWPCFRLQLLAGTVMDEEHDDILIADGEEDAVLVFPLRRATPGAPRGICR